MLEITESAAEQLRRQLSNVPEPDMPRVRLGVIKGTVKMAIDRERPGDTTVNHEGDALVVMDPATSHQLHQRKLDVDEATSALVLK
jgi:Fe-S cluster assembly iron-binding protein IscA